MLNRQKAPNLNDPKHHKCEPQTTRTTYNTLTPRHTQEPQKPELHPILDAVPKLQEQLAE